MDALARRAERADATERDGYRPSVTALDIDRARAGLTDDPLRISIGRLMMDARAAVKVTTRGYSKTERADLATDAALLILRWIRQGEREPIELGPEGSPPLRRDWLEPIDGESERTAARAGTARRRITPGAWRALRAAIKQAAESAARAALESEPEPLQLVEPMALAAMAEAESREPEPRTLPDVDAPETLADIMNLPLAAARALVYRAWHLSPDDAADAWGISRSNVAAIISRGAATIAERYPDPVNLLQALAEAAPLLRERLARAAILESIAWRDGYGDRESAERALADHVAASGAMDPYSLALISAARAALRRAGSRDLERAERIALSCKRIIPAEETRARADLKRSAARGGSHLSGTEEARGGAYCGPIGRPLERLSPLPASAPAPARTWRPWREDPRVADVEPDLSRNHPAGLRSSLETLVENGRSLPPAWPDRLYAGEPSYSQRSRGAERARMYRFAHVAAPDSE